jgi:vacuolar-type H+-ATPase subunit E/Vma4
MAIESLLEALGSEAARDVQQVTEAARAEAAQVRAAAEARVAQRQSAALAARESELRAAADARRATAMREARARRLQARDAFLERVFAAAASQLPGTLETPAHAAALLRLAHEALEFMPRDAVVRCRPSLVSRFTASAVALGTARVVSDDSVREGVVVADNEGRVMIDNTLDHRLRWMRPLLAIELLARFGDAA